MSRIDMDEEHRPDFYLYVDEFQNFATESFADILSEARKYRLNLILGHQYIGQLLNETSTKVRDAIFGNVGTMIIFRVGATDAEFLEKELEPEFNPQDMINLPNYNIYLKLMVNGVTSRPFSAITLPPFSTTVNDNNRETVIELSRKSYSAPKEAVEREIATWSGVLSGKTQFERREKFTPKKKFIPQAAFAHNLGEIGIEFEPPRKKIVQSTQPPLTPKKELDIEELKESIKKALENA